MKRPIAPVAFLFLSVSILLLVARAPLKASGLDADVVLVGNLLLFVVSLLGFILHRKGMDAKGGAVFLGSVYGAFLTRVVLSAAAVFAYAGWKRAGINWPAIFICMFLYLVYTFLETRALLRTHGRKDGSRD